MKFYETWMREDKVFPRYVLSTQELLASGTKTGTLKESQWSTNNYNSVREVLWKKKEKKKVLWKNPAQNA